MSAMDKLMINLKLCNSSEIFGILQNYMTFNYGNIGEDAKKVDALWESINTALPILYEAGLFLVRKNNG